MTQLDSDLLRTFLAVAETGSVTGGAHRIGRSQSATSLRIKQLEGIVGQPLFRRHGRGVTPSAAGDRLLPVARRVTRSLDLALADLRGGGFERHAPDRRVRRSQPLRPCPCHRGFRLAASGCRIGGPVRARGRLRRRVDRRVRWTWRSSRCLSLRSGTRCCARTAWCGWPTGIETSKPKTFCRLRCSTANAGGGMSRWAGLEAADRRHRIVFTSESAVGVQSAVRAGIAAGLLGEAAYRDGVSPLPGMDIRHPSLSRASTGLQHPPARPPTP